MTTKQEDALFEFLENVTEPFTLEDVCAFVKLIEIKRNSHLEKEIAVLLNSRNIAFRIDDQHWVSRRGCFEPVPFVISPTRLELLNGILIPGHRCIPFANPSLLPQKYSFYWKDSPIPLTTTEGPPEEFYPYYCLFGEEYAPQYIARENPANESAYNNTPYEDPPEVSISTLDMRNIYRETSFIPGDCFVARTKDWKEGVFTLERVEKDTWSKAELYAWFEAAERGFEDSIAFLGPGTSTEEQIAYAYWYGGPRMRDVPAYSLEDFLYEKTDRIETVPYGIETRFWYAGKEIPDNKEMDISQTLPDQTLVEDMLFRRKIPISEFVIQSYVLDALFRGDNDILHIINRIAPPPTHLDEKEWVILMEYVKSALEEFRGTYDSSADQNMGPIRQRMGELHTAIIELSARLQKSDIDPSWLPRHTFIILSQLQSHAASILEDMDIMDIDEAPPEAELEAMDNTLDSMIETYEDIKELINDAMTNFRRNRFSIVRGGTDGASSWRTVQISIGGTDVWRRIALPESCCLKELHRIIQAGLEWTGMLNHRFSVKLPDGTLGETPLDAQQIGALCAQGLTEIMYEYGTKWTVKIIILSRYEAGKDELIRCVAGAGSPPPELVEGPLRFRKILAALEKGGGIEKQTALEELGRNFDPGFFDLEQCNRNLRLSWPAHSSKLEPVKPDY
jgi:hypothetical protein